MSEIKSNITVVLPIHKMDDTIATYLEKAIKSIETQKVQPEELILVTPKGVEINITLPETIKLTKVVN